MRESDNYFNHIHRLVYIAFIRSPLSQHNKKKFHKCRLMPEYFREISIKNSK